MPLAPLSGTLPVISLAIPYDYKYCYFGKRLNREKFWVGATSFLSRCSSVYVAGFGCAARQNVSAGGLAQLLCKCNLVIASQQVSGRELQQAARPLVSKKIWIDKTLNENSATDSKF